MHDVELSTEPIGVVEEQSNRESSVVPQARPLIQIRPVPSPNAALGKTAEAMNSMATNHNCRKSDIEDDY